MTQVQAATRLSARQTQLTSQYLHSAHSTDLMLTSLMFELKFKTLDFHMTEKLTEM